MAKAKSVKQILSAIDNDKISLYRAHGHGYWYFCYDDECCRVYETESVYTPRINDMTVGQWVNYARKLEERVYEMLEFRGIN